MRGYSLEGKKKTQLFFKDFILDLIYLHFYNIAKNKTCIEIHKK